MDHDHFVKFNPMMMIEEFKNGNGNEKLSSSNVGKCNTQRDIFKRTTLVSTVHQTTSSRAFVSINVVGFSSLTEKTTKTTIGKTNTMSIGIG